MEVEEETIVCDRKYTRRVETNEAKEVEEEGGEVPHVNKDLKR